jgi:hypothetical protein
MKNDLYLKAYRLSFVDELSETNMQKRYDACEQLLRVSEIIPAREEVLFSDECTIYQSAKSRNVYFWSNENAHFFQELENNPQHVMIWATVSAKHLCDLYFFEGREPRNLLHHVTGLCLSWSI